MISNNKKQLKIIGINTKAIAIENNFQFKNKS